MPRNLIAQLDLAAWRQSVQPPADRWWWRLDEAYARAEEKHDFPWVLLAAALMIITLIPAVDIIWRMWGGDLDPLFVISTCITVVLTSSPLTQAGREVAAWLMDRAHLPTRYRGETMLGMAILSLMVVLLLRSALPAMAIMDNNRGYTLMQAGDLTGAQQAFARAVHINPDYAVGYHNLAEAYVEIGDYDQAYSLYTQALATDPDLDVAYNGLGHVLLLQEKPEQAIRILYTGLRMAQDDVVRTFLWTNLGRAYFAAVRYSEAEMALQQALALSGEEAAAHCTLALTAEALERPENEIILHWENCLRHALDTPEGQELRAMAQAHLRQLEEGRK
jgi:tetratricopeptide (TPR) repeat protein